MRRKGEPAEGLLTMEPARKLTLERDGFIGWYYEPEQDFYEGKALVMVGGSDGYFSLTCLIAEQFVKRGLAVLALAYWNRPGLPDAYERIPIEPVEKAALWLKNNGRSRVGLWGISKGAELALLAGSIFTELISCVVAVCPINVCCEGMRKSGGTSAKKMGMLNCSSWSYRGKELPWAGLSFRKGRIVRDMLREKGVCMRSCYENVVKAAPSQAKIKVERINGPVLFLSAEQDGMWPAREAAEAMMKRLDDQRFPYAHAHYHYAYASHFLLPYKLNSVKMFAIERKYPERCMESNLDSFEKTLAFLKRW